MDRMASVGCPIVVVGVAMLCGGCLTRVKNLPLFMPGSAAPGRALTDPERGSGPFRTERERHLIGTARERLCAGRLSQGRNGRHFRELHENSSGFSRNTSGYLSGSCFRLVPSNARYRSTCRNRTRSKARDGRLCANLRRGGPASGADGKRRDVMALLPESFDQWQNFVAPRIGLFGRVEDSTVVAATVRAPSAWSRR